MAPPQARLPWELEEEILTRLPTKVLVRFRTVCKQWNSLFDNRSFIYNHLSLPRPQFILLTKYKIYSIDFTDPTIKLCVVNSYPLIGLTLQNANITTCDEFLFCNYPRPCEKGEALWNPWLKQFKWNKLVVDKHFDVFGLGYDSSSRPNEKVYKMLGYMRCPPKVERNGYLTKVVDRVYKMLDYFKSPPEDQRNEYPRRVAIYECASQTLRFIDTPHDEDMPICETAKRSHVSLNGNLYWIDYSRHTREYFIQSFDFSREIFRPVCVLPFQESPSCDEHVLAVFKGDRFSLLRQCYLTRKIEIWVTKRKIDDREEVVWMKFMTLTATNLPKLFNKLYGVSYFIYDETLVMCCGDDVSGQPCIYIVKGGTCSKIKIVSGITWFSHCAYVPNWTSVPLEF